MTPDSPYAWVEKCSGQFQKRNAHEPMLSLSNAFKRRLGRIDARLRKLTNRAIEYVYELKIDGLSIALTYQDGQLVLERLVVTERLGKM